MSFFFFIGIIFLIAVLLVFGYILSFFFMLLRGIYSIGDFLPWKRKKKQSADVSASKVKVKKHIDRSMIEDAEYEEIK